MALLRRPSVIQLEPPNDDDDDDSIPDRASASASAAPEPEAAVEVLGAARSSGRRSCADAVAAAATVEATAVAEVRRRWSHFNVDLSARSSAPSTTTPCRNCGRHGLRAAVFKGGPSPRLPRAFDSRTHHGKLGDAAGDDDDAASLGHSTCTTSRIVMMSLCGTRRRRSTTATARAGKSRSTCSVIGCREGDGASTG